MVTGQRPGGTGETITRQGVAAGHLMMILNEGKTVVAVPNSSLGKGGDPT